MNRIFVVHLIKEKLDQFKESFPFYACDLALISNKGHLFDGGRKLEIDKGVDSIKNALGLIFGMCSSFH